MTIAQDYLTGLKNAYLNHEADELWDYFEDLRYGASEQDIALIKQKFPNVPNSLLEILKFVDGTDCLENKGERLYFSMFGSIPGSDYSYNCLLNSCEQILNAHDISFLATYVNRTLDPEWEIPIDDKIIDDFEKINWLHFSDCVNNGGTVMMFIDFSPSPVGKMGQVIMYLHDPDELTVIADSFDEYLQKIMGTGYQFIDEYTKDEF